MNATLLRAAMLTLALGVAGCTEATLEQAGLVNGQLPPRILADMKAKGMKRDAPVMARIFKEEGKLEIWKQKQNGRYDVIASYDICKWSGQLGPKFTEGDRQAPEGFYSVRPAQMNPKSSYHLSFNIGYPNTFDRVHGRTGSNLMVHGACSSSGCYSMTNDQIEEIYAFGREAFGGGQQEFQIQAFPFRMTAANMARYRDDPNYAFWTNLKEGYDQFEITKVPPKVDVCEKRYVFNQIPEGGATFSPAGACPASVQPDALASAYRSYKADYERAFEAALKGKAAPRRSTIAGVEEAKLVSEWTRKRARGERVPVEPPSLEHDGSVAVTARMGRIDSPAGRRQAELEAVAEAKAKAEAEKKAIALAKAEAKKAEELARKAAAAAPVVVEAPAEAAPAEAVSAAPEVKPGLLARARGRITGLFGS